MSATRLDEPATRAGGPGDRRPPRAAVRVAWLLARAEARRLVRHPATWTGLVLSLLSLANPYVFGPDDVMPVLHRDATTLGGYATPLAVAALVVGFLAASRPAREDAEEHVAAAPAPPAARTLGALGTAVAACVVGAVWTALAVGLFLALGGVGAPTAADLAQPVLLVGAAAAVGVAIGTWVPRAVLAVAAIVVLVAVQLVLTGGSGGPEHTLAPVLLGSDLRLPELTVRPVGWHLVHLAGLLGLSAAAALLRHGTTARRTAAAAVAVSVVATAATAQVAARPTFEELGELVAFTRDPGLRCENHPAATACTLPRYAELGARWSETVQAVVQHAPPAAGPLGRTRIEQQVEPHQVVDALYDWYGQGANLAFQTRYLQDGGASLVPELSGVDPLVLDARWTPRAELALAALTARRLVGIPDVERASHTWTEHDLQLLRDQSMLPPEGEPSEVPVPVPGSTIRYEQRCWLAGQAREALAIWLAADTSPAHAARLRDAVAAAPAAPADPDEVLVSSYEAELTELKVAGPIVWSKVGADLAAQLLDVPDARRRLFAGWDRWSSPASTVDDLAAAFGLAVPRASAGIDPYRPDTYGPITATGEVPELPVPVREDVSPCLGPT